MEKVFKTLEDLSKQEIIVKKGIGVYMDGSAQTMLHKTTVGVEFKGHIETLEQALAELKAIKESKSSEAINCLDWMLGYISLDMCSLEEVSDNYDIIKQVLLKVQLFDKAYEDVKALPLESLIETYKKDVVLDIFTKEIEQLKKENADYKKVLEIIKEKNVNIGLVKVLGSVEQYNQTYVYDNMLNVKWCLTQEEFDLLKKYANKVNNNGQD